METTTALIVSTGVAAIIAMLVAMTCHDRMPTRWQPVSDWVIGTTVGLLALSAVILVNGIGWQWIAVAGLMWALPGCAVAAMYVQDANKRSAREKQRNVKDEQSTVAIG